MSDTYNRLAAGERLRLKRTLLGMTQEEMAERIGRVPIIEHVPGLYYFR